jgi:hypothetical protein
LSDYGSDPIELETSFAAAVANAASSAAILRKHGLSQTPADQVGCALADLWDHGIATGLSCREVSAIANKYVEYDADGEAWPRSMGNVFRLLGG